MWFFYSIKNNMLSNIEKISHKQLKKTLITAKLQNKIFHSKNIVLYNNVLSFNKNKSFSSSFDLNKFSKNFFNAFKNVIFKFPAKVKIYDNNFCFLNDFADFSSIVIKNNNLVLKNIKNSKIIQNFSYVHVYKLLFSLINPFFYFSKFI